MIFTYMNTVLNFRDNNMINLSHQEQVCLLFPSLGNVNYYVAHVDSKYADLDGNNSLSKLEYKRFDFFFLKKPEHQEFGKYISISIQ